MSVWPAGRPFIYQTKHPCSTVSTSSLSLGRRSAVPVCAQVGGALGQTRSSPLCHPSLCSSIMPFPPEGTRVTTSGHSHLDVPGTSQPGSHSSATSTKPRFHHSDSWALGLAFWLDWQMVGSVSALVLQLCSYCEVPEAVNNLKISALLFLLCFLCLTHYISKPKVIMGRPPGFR